ncbi:hypothetical protein D3C86_2137510 [compost metagenome]
MATVNAGRCSTLTGSLAGDAGGIGRRWSTYSDNADSMPFRASAKASPRVSPAAFISGISGHDSQTPGASWCSSSGY